MLTGLSYAGVIRVRFNGFIATRHLSQMAPRGMTDIRRILDQRKVRDVLCVRVAADAVPEKGAPFALFLLWAKRALFQTNAKTKAIQRIQSPNPPQSGVLMK